MLKKLLFVLPPVIFLSVIIGVYVIWQRPINDDIPPTSTPGSLNHTPTPTRSPPTNTTTPAQTMTKEPASPVPTTSPADNTPSPPIPTAIPANTSTPTPPITPTPVPLFGIVIAENLNIRQGPSSNYGLLGGLKRGNQIIIMRRTPTGNWLEIKTPDGKIGWVAAEYVEIPPEIDIGLIPMATVGPTPTLPPTPSRPPSHSLLAFDLRGGSVFGRLNAKQEQWYIFSVIGPETVITLMFSPNVNFFGDQFQAYTVQFSIYSQNQIPYWYPGDPGVSNLGVGSHTNDRDGDYGTGELVWRSGNLPVGTSYYLRIVNESAQAIRYCLAPTDEHRWNCPQK